MYESLGTSPSQCGLRIEELECRTALYAPAILGDPSPSTAVAPLADWRAGLSTVHDVYGLTGAGQTVVVIDSGVAYDHPALGAGFGPGARVVGGADFSEEQDGDPYDDGPVGGHGTHVAGIIASNDPRYPGVAPDVQIVALRVFNDQGISRFAWIEQALQWVIENRTAFGAPITTVNLSIGMDPGEPVTANERVLDDELTQLVDAGIFVSVAAGNGYDRLPLDGASYPAAHPHVVPVGSVGGDGLLSDFSRRTPEMLVAPGEDIHSTAPDYLDGFNRKTDDWYRFSGTSQAAPYVSGAAILVRQALERAGWRHITQAEIASWLRRTADWVFDPATQQSYPRVNLERAITQLLPEPVDPTATEPDAGIRVNAIEWEQDTRLGIQTVQLQSGGAWTKFTAAAEGPLMVQTQFPSGQHIRLAVYDASGTKRGQNETRDGNARMVTQVVAGEAYFVELVGADAMGELFIAQPERATAESVRWRIPASVGHVELRQSSVLEIGLDGFRWQPEFGADQQLELVLEGHSSLGVKSGNASIQAYVRSNTLDLVGLSTKLRVLGISQVRLDASQGTADELRVYGTAADERWSSRAGIDTFLAPNLELVATQFERSFVFGGGGIDVAQLHGTQYDDLFVGTPQFARLSDSRQLDLVEQFTKIYVYAGAGGVDRAFLRGDDGNDSLAAYPHATRLASDQRLFYTESFDRVYATAGEGGLDRAYLYGSDGQDEFVGSPTHARMYGGTYLNVADLFDRVYAYGGGGTRDSAHLLGSPDDDLVTARLDEFSLGNAHFYVGTHGFDHVFADLNQGGSDEAVMTARDDAFNRLYLGLDNARMLVDGIAWDVMGMDRLSVKRGRGATHRGFVTETRLVTAARDLGFVQPLYDLDAPAFTWRSDIRFEPAS